jgi:hypothetical protein
MDEIIKIVEENILKGLVIDDKGKWVTIHEKIERENKFITHLEAGEVLNNGRWIPIEEAKRKITDSMDPLLCVGTFTELEETKDISSFVNNKSVPKLIPQNDLEPKAASSSFISCPIIEAEQETKFLERVDLKSSSLSNQSADTLTSDNRFETMPCDMNSVMNTAKVPLQKRNSQEINPIVENWERERKKSRVLLFSTIITTILAITGAVFLAFVL